jgi:hypothetical protein
MPRKQSVHDRKFELNARDPITRLLSRELILPEIYFEANWPAERASRVGIMAIDRAGTGDLHLVEVKPRVSDLFKVLPAFLEIPAHYRWLAFDRSRQDPEDIAALMEEERLYPIKGMGRVGMVEIFKMQDGIDLGARVIVRPLRFQAQLKDSIQAFRRSTSPDIDFPSD